MKHRNLSLFFLFIFLISAILSTSVSYSLLELNTISHTKSVVDVDHKKDQNVNDFFYEENDGEAEIDFDLANISLPLLLVIFNETEFSKKPVPSCHKYTNTTSPIYLEVCNFRV